MKRLYVYIGVLLCAMSAFAQVEFTFTSAADMNQTKEGISVVISKGSGSTAPSATVDYQTQDPEMRLYTGNTITISTDGSLTNIQMVFAKSSASNKQYTGLSASTGDLVSGGVSEDKNDWKIDSWTGNAASVVFTLTDKGQRRIQKIVIDGAPVIIDTVVTVLPTAEDLQAEYVYAEPTTVLPKDTVLWKEEYAFIDHNILVECNMGSIVKATDTSEAYFNCNAGYQLTFTATQPIKGIEIDGFVRKAFNATCDHGTIQYLTDQDNDMEGWPAMVLLDVHAESVTLNCPKQLRCYGVRVYFQGNPDPLYNEEGIENVQGDDVPYTKGCTKVLRDGHIYLMYKGTMYDVQGTRFDVQRDNVRCTKE